jgi:hypothetical protein
LPAAARPLLALKIPVDGAAAVDYALRLCTGSVLGYASRHAVLAHEGP